MTSGRKKMNIEEIVSKMTLEEKASLLSGKDFWQTENIDRLGVPSIFLSDGPSGLRKQAAAADRLGLNKSIPATCFPSSSTLANSWNESVTYEVGKALGEEASYEKVSVLLGPGANMKRNPRCGRNFEYYTEDPYLAGKMASGFVRGIQDENNGVSACVKHFAANNQEERRMVIDTILDERTLREIYLTAFEIVVREGKTKTIMSSYNKINGDFTNENQPLMDILRKEWGYEGVVVTDWGGSNDRVDGLRAGNELEMPTTAGETNEEVIQAVKDGRIEEKYLDDAVKRLLKLIDETTKAREDKENFSVEAHHKVAERAAEESVVLLKNDGVLPLDVKKKIAVIGNYAKNPRYQGAGSSIVNPTRIDSAFDLFPDAVEGYIGYEQGFDRYGKKSKKLASSAIKLASSADVIIMYIGLDEVSEAEGVDRPEIKLPQNQIDLIDELSKLSKPIVGVLSCGSVIEMPWVDKLSALVHSSLGGQAGAGATISVLTGKVNPSGKLSETYLYNYEDTPSFKHFPGKMKSVEYREGLFIGYRYFDTTGIAVRFPFGYGLSYTSFEYSDLEVTETGVSFNIKNTGKLDGKEIAQLYIGLKYSNVFRPKKELKGFTKVFVKAGETVKAEIPFDDKSFRYFDISTNKWEIETGDYDIYIGASVKDIRLEGKIHKDGVKNTPYDKKQLISYFTGRVDDVDDAEFTALIGRPIPSPEFDFYKKNRMKLGYNDTVGEIRYARGAFTRFLFHVLNGVYKLMKKTGKRSTANLIEMSVYNQPFRGLSRLTGGAINMPMLDGILVIVNGNFFKGLGIFLKENGKKNKANKLKQKAEKEKQSASAN